MFETVQDHEKRIKILEDNFVKFTDEFRTELGLMTTKMSTMENAQLQTQNILLTSKQEQDKLLHQIVEQNGEIVKHTLDIKKEGKAGFWKVAGIAVGSGGFLVVALLGIIELVQRFIG